MLGNDWLTRRIASITLGKTWSPGEPQHYARGQWAGFAVMLCVNLIGTSHRT